MKRLAGVLAASLLGACSGYDVSLAVELPPAARAESEALTLVIYRDLEGVSCDDFAFSREVTRGLVPSSQTTVPLESSDFDVELPRRGQKLIIARATSAANEVVAGGCTAVGPLARSPVRVTLALEEAVLVTPEIEAFDFVARDVPPDSIRVETANAAGSALRTRMESRWWRPGESVLTRRHATSDDGVAVIELPASALPGPATLEIYGLWNETPRVLRAIFPPLLTVENLADETLALVRVDTAEGDRLLRYFASVDAPLRIELYEPTSSGLGAPHRDDGELIGPAVALIDETGSSSLLQLGLRTTDSSLVWRRLDPRSLAPLAGEALALPPGSRSDIFPFSMEALPRCESVATEGAFLVSFSDGTLARYSLPDVELSAGFPLPGADPGLETPWSFLSFDSLGCINAAGASVPAFQFFTPDPRVQGIALRYPDRVVVRDVTRDTGLIPLRVTTRSTSRSPARLLSSREGAEGGRLELYEATSGGELVLVDSLAHPGSALQLDSGDFNGDGYTDVVAFLVTSFVLEASQTRATLFIAYGDDDGFSPNRSFFDIESNVFFELRLETADVDQDGFDDVLLYNLQSEDESVSPSPEAVVATAHMGRRAD